MGVRCVPEEKLEKLLSMKAEELLKNDEFLYRLRSALEDWIFDALYDEVSTTLESVLDTASEKLSEAISQKLDEVLDEALEKAIKKTVESIDPKTVVGKALKYFAKSI